MENVAASIASNARPVSLLEFADYFRLLRACYVLALDQVKFQESYSENDDSDVAVVVRATTAEEIASAVVANRVAMPPEEFEQLVYRKLSVEDDLWLTSIVRTNPFDVVFAGISIALTAAIIVSGGKFQLGPTGLKIEIPPLGEGIKKLRMAIGAIVGRKGKRP